MKPVTLITGGSRGIGAACVRIFAAQGRRVWFTYYQSEAAAQQLAARTGAVPIRSTYRIPHAMPPWQSRFPPPAGWSCW